MIVGVTGDTHNNLKNIKIICSIFNENRADLVLHTGDISLPKSLLAFKELNCPMIAVLGNNDIGDEKQLRKASKEFGCEIFYEPHTIETEERIITLIHHPDLINEEMLKKSDVILHGHTHMHRHEKINGCLVFNPGECAGFMEGKNQVGIIDLKNMKPKVINF